MDWVQVGLLWDKQHETRAPNETHVVRKSPLTLGRISRANIEGRLYLAKFMKTAPAGSWRPGTLNRLNESKYCQETQLLPMGLLR